MKIKINALWILGVVWIALVAPKLMESSKQEPTKIDTLLIQAKQLQESANQIGVIVHHLDSVARAYNKIP